MDITSDSIFSTIMGTAAEDQHSREEIISMNDDEINQKRNLLYKKVNCLD